MRINDNCICKTVFVCSGSKLFFSWLCFGTPLQKSPYIAYSITNNSNQKNRFIIYLLIAKDENNPLRQEAFSYCGFTVLGIFLSAIKDRSIWLMGWLSNTEKSDWSC